MPKRQNARQTRHIGLAGSLALLACFVLILVGAAPGASAVTSVANLTTTTVPVDCQIYGTGGGPTVVIVNDVATISLDTSECTGSTYYLVSYYSADNNLVGYDIANYPEYLYAWDTDSTPATTPTLSVDLPGTCWQLDLL